VARYSGVELERKRKIAWNSLAIALVVGIPFAYWTYKLSQDGFAWPSILTGLVAGFMLIGGLGILLTGDDSPGEQNGD
jgi:hypothetical protein